MSPASSRYIWLILLVSAAFTIGHLHASKGFDLTDEGWYASTAMRYSLGDVPFRDEILSSNRSFDILLSILFRLDPEISLRQLRLIGNLIHLSATALIFLFLSRYAMPALAALLCLIMFLINNFFGILTPSYSSLSSDFSLVSMTLWFFSLASEERGFRAASSIFAGSFLGLAAISYSPIFFVISVPFVFLAITFLAPNRYGDFRRPTLLFIVTFATVIAAAFLSLAVSGILPDFIRANMESLKTYPLGAQGPATKLYRSTKNLSRHLPHLLDILRSGDIRQARIAFIFITLAVSLIAAFLRRTPPGQDMAGRLRWGLAKNLLFAWGLASSFIYGLSSSSGSSCILGLTPLFLAGMASLYGSVKGRSFLAAPYFTLVVVLLIWALNYNHRAVYKDAEPDRLTAGFTHPKLAGIYSTPEKVRTMEELLDYLKSRVRPKDYLLAYNHIPGLYYLTDTRPAYASAWARDERSPSLKKKLVERMIEGGRIPEYCVRMLAYPHDWKKPIVYEEGYALDTFVKKNYHLEKTIYPFEIWRRVKVESVE